MIDSSGLISLVVWIIIIGLVFYVLWWGLGQIALPEPFDKIARVLIVVVAVLLLINALLGLVGNAPFRLKG